MLNAERTRRRVAILYWAALGARLDLNPEVKERAASFDRFALEVNANVCLCSNGANQALAAQPGSDKSRAVVTLEAVLVNSWHRSSSCLANARAQQPGRPTRAPDC